MGVIQDKVAFFATDFIVGVSCMQQNKPCHRLNVNMLRTGKEIVAHWRIAMFDELV
jgi:hypothetical protein